MLITKPFLSSSRNNNEILEFVYRVVVVVQCVNAIPLAAYRNSPVYACINLHAKVHSMRVIRTYVLALEASDVRYWS